MIRAAIFDRSGSPFRFESFPRPELTAGEVLVRISTCTICASDLHTFAGRRPAPIPTVLGHEPVGIIEQIKGEVFDVAGKPIQIGDRVVWSVAASCNKCFFCTSGLPQKCVSLRKYGHESVVLGVGPFGGLATHCHLVPGTAIVRVPASIPDRVAAPAGCATATVAAAMRVGTITAGADMSTAGNTIVVMGLGMLGLTACAMAATRGYTVIGCEVDEARVALAERFGAAQVAKPSAITDLVRAATGNRGADLVLEITGSPSSAQLSLDLLRIGGTAVWVGAVFPTEPVPVAPELIVRRCLTVRGIHNYGPADLASAIEFLSEHQARYPFEELVPHTFSLDSVTAAFEFAEERRPIRVAIQCE
jgi:putative phosphonate catabolism associated alcohol dehydrogenase